MTYYMNKTDVRGDGRIILFQRPKKDKKTALEVWHVRINIPLPQSKGYFFSTTHERNIGRATQFALNKYDELYQKVKGGGTITSSNWTNLVKEWSVAFPTNQKEPDRKPQYIQHAINQIKNHPTTFFVNEKNNPKIDNITSTDIQNYYSWRRQFLPVPKNSTLKKEAVNINLVLKYAYDKGYISTTIKVDYPKLESVKISRHAGFTKVDWDILLQGMRDGVKEKQNSNILRNRFYLQHFVLISASCGARVGEMRTLRWLDIERNTTITKNLVGSVDGKTGPRIINFQTQGERYITRLYNYRKKELGEAPPTTEYLFCNPKGQTINTYRKGFQTLLDKLNILYDNRGRKRTIYSLRHYYSILRLERGVNVFVLSKQLGNSVSVLEKHYGDIVVKLMSEQITQMGDNEKKTIVNAKTLPWG